MEEDEDDGGGSEMEIYLYLVQALTGMLRNSIVFVDRLVLFSVFIVELSLVIKR